MTTFIVEGIPGPQGSKNAYIRAGRPILVESSKKVGPWRDTVAIHARQHFPTPLDGPIKISVQFVMPRPKNWGRKRSDPMTQKPDLDKLIRSTCDALTKIAYHDDSQVTEITGRKRRAVHGETPGAVIRVTEAQPTTN